MADAVRVLDNSHERVALELMEKVLAETMVNGRHAYATEEALLNLYGRCLLATHGRTPERTRT